MTSPLPTNARKQRRKSLDCPHCGKTFERHEHMERHARTHTGERPFNCPFPDCTRVFSRYDNMLQHFRCHVFKGYRNKHRDIRQKLRQQIGAGLTQEVLSRCNSQGGVKTPQSPKSPSSETAEGMYRATSSSSPPASPPHINSEDSLPYPLPGLVSNLASPASLSGSSSSLLSGRLSNSSSWSSVSSGVAQIPVESQQQGPGSLRPDQLSLKFHISPSPISAFTPMQINRSDIDQQYITILNKNLRFFPY